MLDQNTDRMWYVIGAVIVGAAIILIMNGTMPQIFASVADSFESAATGATSDIDRSTANKLDTWNLTYGEYITHENGELAVTKTSFNEALSGYIPVTPNTSYTFHMSDIGGHGRVTYFDANKQYVQGFYENIVPIEGLTTPAPANAAYARISAKHEVSELHLEAVPVENWWFGLTEELATMSK